MTKPQIATILEDGIYGQREMTDEEYAQYLETIKLQISNETSLVQTLSVSLDHVNEPVVVEPVLDESTDSLNTDG